MNKSERFSIFWFQISDDFVAGKVTYRDVMHLKESEIEDTDKHPFFNVIEAWKNYVHKL